MEFIEVLLASGQCSTTIDMSLLWGLWLFVPVAVGDGCFPLFPFYYVALLVLFFSPFAFVTLGS
jgi:hypothetical protein